MANNWRYFQDTGKEGGSPNLAQGVFYIDALNGSDVTGDGSHDNPFKSIQKAMDTKTTTYTDYIVAGYFEGVNAGGFISLGTYGAIIAEGNVIFNGSTAGSFKLSSYGTSYNKDIASGSSFRNYGRLTFLNYTTAIDGNYGSGVDDAIYNCDFINCTSLFDPTQSVYGRYKNVLNCLFKNCIIGGVSGYWAPTTPSTIFHNNFINCNIRWRGQFAASMNIQSNYFDATTILDFTPLGLTNTVAQVMDYNFIEGTLTDKIKVIGGNYNNVEAFKIAFPTKEMNGLPSTTVPLFNQINTEDYTLQETSPLIKAAHDKKQIGAFGVAYANNDFSNAAVWTATGVDVSVAGEVTLTASPTGTIETTAATGIQLFPKKRVVEGIYLPDFEINVGLGEWIGANLAADNTPFLMDIEIQYSDDGVTFNAGGYLKVPVGVPPLHDTVNNVGNDDALFDVNNAVPIACKFMKIRVTFRNNEVTI